MDVDYKRFVYSVALDNHDPARDVLHNEGYEYTHPTTGVAGVKLPEAEKHFKDAYRSIYLIDDGSVVTPYYVAGYNPENEPGTVFLHPFPTNPDGRTRPDNGRVIDYSTWMHGPKRAYHLKITRYSFG